MTLKFHIQTQYSSLLLHDWSLGTIQNACGENSALWLVHKANLGRNCPCFDPCDLEIWSLTFKINRVLHQHMLKPHVQYTFPTAKTLNCSSLTKAQIYYVLTPVTSKFDLWPPKTIGFFKDPWLILMCDINCLQQKLWPVACSQGPNLLCFDPGDLKIWHLTSKNNRVLYWPMIDPHVRYKLPTAKTLTCSSLTRPKLTMFWPRWPQNLTFDLQKQ